MSANLHKWQEKADYKDMRCLYCGKELALLKRLTRSEFCSDAHKQSYQDEYNRLALSRLLQAQSKSDENKSKAGKAALQAERPKPETMPEPAGEPEPELAGESPWSVREAASEPAHQSALVPEPVAKIESAPEPIAAQVEAEPDLVATGTADFLSVERPSMRDVAFAITPIPAGPLDWPPQHAIPGLPATATGCETAALPRAGLVPLDPRPPASTPERPPVAAELRVPQAANRDFSNDSVNMDISLKPAAPQGLPSARPVALIVPARIAEAGVEDRDDQPPGFSFEFEFHESMRGELVVTGIKFPPEDSEVTASGSDENTRAWPETNGTPRGALEALAKLHKAIKGEHTQEGSNEDLDHGEDDGVPLTGPVIDTTELERLVGVTPRVRVPVRATGLDPALPDGHGAVVQAVAVRQVEAIAEEAGEFVSARATTQLLAMPVKLFAPPKARLAPSFPALPHQPEPHIPAGDALPLRPKLAINTAPPVTPPKVGETKPAAVPVPRKPTFTPPAPKAPAVAAKTAAPESKPPAPSVTTPPAAPATPVKISAPVKETQNPVAPAPQKEPLPPPPSAVEPLVELSGPNLMFTNSSGSFIGALSTKAKIMAAVALLLVAIVLAYMAFGSSKKGVSAGGSSEAVATSIMMGEGGWVTNWAGDSTGLHRGRQITIYRPSLKLSDCRIEFQGRIVNNSIGWVFRALDSGNYYAMKVVQTASGVRLQKYAVVQGREHDQGQVVLQAPSGGLFTIRVDVRGPRFSTYIQGQPLDIWTDNQIKTGGVGFLNDRGDRAEIKNVSISYLTGVGN